MKNLPTNLLTDLLTEKIKRDNSVEYMNFVNHLNDLACEGNTLADLRELGQQLDCFMPQLDLIISVTDDYEDIMNMKATLLDLLVNDLNEKSICLLISALSKNKKWTHLHDFMAPMEHWVVVIDSRKEVAAS
ncbi:hypothetical protein [Bacillus sp. 1P06AnD]|uniref:hypothetical protein n=1 Tax=Bacillus sp. 1P06AnD TaxID=3132208 RepID=UPI00399EFA6F